MTDDPISTFKSTTLFETDNKVKSNRNLAINTVINSVKSACRIHCFHTSTEKNT